MPGFNLLGKIFWKVFFIFFSCLCMSEREALISFFNETNGRFWFKSTSWNSSLPLRLWYGIKSLSSADVEELILIENHLEGRVSEALCQLAGLHRLKTLSLRGNNLYGKLDEKNNKNLMEKYSKLKKFKQLDKEKRIFSDKNKIWMKEDEKNEDKTDDNEEDTLTSSLTASLMNTSTNKSIQVTSSSSSLLTFSYQQDKVNINSSIFRSIKVDPFFPTLTNSTRHLIQINNDHKNQYNEKNRHSNLETSTDSFSSNSSTVSQNSSPSNDISLINIPHFFMKLSNTLELLDLSWNKLEGDLPLDLFLLRNLTILRLSFNQFSGELEELPFEKLINLQVLEINNNLFRGKSPHLWLKNRCPNIIRLNDENNLFDS